MNIQNFPIEKIIPYARNPRKNDEAIPKVMASIKEFGFQQPIVIDKENVIIAGHTRYIAAQRLGMTEVPVHIANELTDSQVKAYRIADNKVSEKSTWDHELLQLEIDDLKLVHFDIDILGFDFDSSEESQKDESEESVKEKSYSNKFEVVIKCADETDQEAVYKLMTSKGYECQVLSM